MINLFFTGKIQVGKSTLLREVLETLNLSMGGYITNRVVKDNRTIFMVQSLYDGVTKLPISIMDNKNYDKEIFADSFKTGIVSILEESLKHRDLIVLDELGFMENDIYEFTSTVHKILDSQKPVLGVLKEYDCDFLNSIKNRADTVIIEVNQQNRDYLLDKVMDVLRAENLPFKDDRFIWKPQKIHWYNKALDHPKCSYPHTFLHQIKEYIGNLKGKTVLDIGSGSGAFAIPLLKEGAYVTAVDSSLNMMLSLAQRADSNNLDGLNCIISPFDDINVPKHDFAISAFSGGSTKSHETISKMSKFTKEYSFIISCYEKPKQLFKKDIVDKMVNKSNAANKRRQNDISRTRRILNELGYDYKCKTMTYELSQYFNTIDEAISFFAHRLNIVEGNKLEALRKTLNSHLPMIGNEYVYENINKAYLMAVKSNH